MQSLESSCQEADYMLNEALQKLRRNSINSMVDHASLSLIDHTDYTDASASSIITNPSISPPATLVSLKHHHHNHQPHHNATHFHPPSPIQPLGPPPNPPASTVDPNTRGHTTSAHNQNTHKSLNNNNKQSHANSSSGGTPTQRSEQHPRHVPATQPHHHTQHASANHHQHHNNIATPTSSSSTLNAYHTQHQSAGKRSLSHSSGSATAPPLTGVPSSSSLSSSSSSTYRGSPPKRSKNSSSSSSSSSASATHHHHSSKSSGSSASAAVATSSVGSSSTADHHNHHHHHQSTSSSSSSTSQPFFDIHKKLRETYNHLYMVDHFNRILEPRVRQKTRSFALERLVEIENLNTVVLNLYAGNKGYSLAFRQDTATSVDRHVSNKHSMHMDPVEEEDEENLVETMRWPYEVEGLLQCIDNETLPMLFINLLEARSPNVFYSGCVIMEVRDYRQSFEIAASCDTYFVLLKPTTQTLLNDVNLIAAEADFSAEDKLALESHLVLATAGPLCLDPDPQIGRNAINNQHKRQLWNTAPIRRQMKKFSQLSINRKRKTDQFTATPGMELHDHIARVRHKQRLHAEANGEPMPQISGIGRFTMRRTAAGNTAAPSDLMRPKRAPVLEYPFLAAPSEVNVKVNAEKKAKPREREDFMPKLIEEHVLETDRGGGRVYHIKLSIYQRPADSEFLGELYVDRDYKDSGGSSEGTYVMPSGTVPYLTDIRADLRGAEKERNGKACQFSLGTRLHATRYIQQFTDIFTEEGRKPVKVKLIVNGREYDRTGKLEHQQPNWQQQQHQQQQHLVQNHHGTAAGSISLAAGLSTTNVNSLPGNSNNNNSGQSSGSSGIPVYQYLTNSTSVSPSQQQPQHSSNTVQSQSTAHHLPFIQPPGSINQQQVVQHIYTTTQSDGSSGLQQQQQLQQQLIQLQQQHQQQLQQSMQQQPHQQQQHINLTNGSVVVVQQQTGNITTIQRMPHHQSGGTMNNGATMRTTSSVPVLQAHLQAVPQTQHQLHSQQQPQQQLQQPPQQQHLQQHQQSTASEIIHTTNPEITALVTSFMNSANQFQQQQQAAAAAAAAAAQQQQQQQSNAPQKSNSSSNAAIISLLNSAPAAMTSSPVVNSSLSATNLNPSTLPPETLLNAPTTPNAIKQTLVPSTNNGQNILTTTGNMRKITMQQHQQLQQQQQQQQQLQQQQQQSSRIHNQTNLITVNSAGNIINTTHLVGGPNNSSNNINSNHTSGHEGGQPQQQLNVRVTMSALASQLASPPAVMSNAVIQSQSFNFAQQQSGQSGQSSLKQQLQNNSGVSQPIILNAGSARSLLNQQQQQVIRRESMTAPSPGSDSNASNASSTANIAYSMPGLNALLNTSPTTSISGDGGPHSNPGSTSSALLDRLNSVGGGSQQSVPSPSSQFMTPSPKSSTPLLQQQLHQINQVQSPASSISPMSSPPPQPQQQQQQPHQSQTTTTLNLQGINLSSLQGAIATFPHLQNVQVQIPGIAQPISLPLTGAVGAALATAGAAAAQQNQSGTTNLMVSVPVTNTTQVNHIQAVPSGGQTIIHHQQQQQLLQAPSGGSGTGAGGSTMLSLPFNQLVTSNTKGISQQTLQRAVAANCQQTGNLQLLGTAQRPRSIGAQALVNKQQQQLNARGIMVAQQQQLQQQQRNANSIKMSPVSISAGQSSNQSNTNSVVVTQQLQLKLQKQAQFQQSLNNHSASGGTQQHQHAVQQHHVIQQLQQLQPHIVQTTQQQSQLQQQLHHQSATVGQTMIIPSASGIIVQAASKQHRRGSATADTNK